MMQAKRLKNLWAKFTHEGSETYLAIDAWQYGTSVIQDIMGDLEDGMAPLCVYKHKDFNQYEREGAVPVIYPIKAGGAGCTDPDAEMLRYAMVQFENGNVELLTARFEAALAAYKTYHRIRDDKLDGFIYAPYQETGKLIGQIQNLKAVPSGSGLAEKRISSRTQRDYWSAVKYALRVAQVLESEYLIKPKQKSDWDAMLSRFENTDFEPLPGGANGNNRLVIGRKGGRLF